MVKSDRQTTDDKCTAHAHYMLSN